LLNCQGRGFGEDVVVVVGCAGPLFAGARTYGKQPG